MSVLIKPGNLEIATEWVRLPSGESFLGARMNPSGRDEDGRFHEGCAVIPPTLNGSRSDSVSSCREARPSAACFTLAALYNSLRQCFPSIALASLSAFGMSDRIEKPAWGLFPLAIEEWLSLR
jgi:hypothetical protein